MRLLLRKQVLPIRLAERSFSMALLKRLLHQNEVTTKRIGLSAEKTNGRAMLFRYCFFGC